MATEVVIEAYKQAWLHEFETEKRKIQHAIEGEIFQIEHIGSTSIVGLPSKPIIDIAIGVNRLDEADAFIEPLHKLGYEYVPKAEFPTRRFFRKGGWRKGTHHLHFYERNSEAWNNNLLFRNYLRSHPEKVEEYAQLKKHLASLYSHDRPTYTQLKSPFIQSIIELAKNTSS